MGRPGNGLHVFVFCRYQVYVCTMGETEYAHEMVRLLDSGEFKIIPQEQRRHRIVHVPHHLKKTLPGVLSPHHCNTGDIRPGACKTRGYWITARE